MDVIITSPVRPTHRERGKVEAWLYHGQPRDEWPDWVQSHLAAAGIDIPPRRKGSWAVRDDEGYFWRWLKSEIFTGLYEPI